MGLIYENFFVTPCKHPHIRMIYNVCTVSQKWVVFDERLVVSNQTTCIKVIKHLLLLLSIIMIFKTFWPEFQEYKTSTIVPKLTGDNDFDAFEIIPLEENVEESPNHFTKYMMRSNWSLTSWTWIHKFIWIPGENCYQGYLNAYLSLIVIAILLSSIFIIYRYADTDPRVDSWAIHVPMEIRWATA